MPINLSDVPRLISAFLDLSPILYLVLTVATINISLLLVHKIIKLGEPPERSKWEPRTPYKPHIETAEKIGYRVWKK